jgi:hypothetical protein
MALGLALRGLPGTPGPPGPAGGAGDRGAAVFGQDDRFYAEVAVALTFEGHDWVAKNDTDSRPHNVTGVTTDSQKIRVEHDGIDGIHIVGSPRADPGENLSSVGIRAITRPTPAYTDIILRQDRVIADALTNPGNNTAWVREKGLASEITATGLDVPGDFAAYTQGLANVAAAWRLSEASGTVLDDAIGANDGTVVGSGTTYGVTGGLVSDPADKALTTTGISTNELTFPMAGITQAAFSIVMRFKSPATSTLVLRDNTGSTDGYFISKSGTSIGYRMGNITYVTTTAWSALCDDNWHTVILTKNGSAVTFDLDGVLIHSANTAGSNALATPWHIGRSGTAGAYLPQTLSELVTYSRALTTTEKALIHGAAISDGNLHITHPNLGNTRASGITLTRIGNLQPVIVAGSITTTGFQIKFLDSAGAKVVNPSTDMAVAIERKVVNRIIDPTAISVDVKVVKEDTWPNVVGFTAPIWWQRLGELSGTSFNDEIGSNDGTSQATVTLGATGVISGDSNKAVTFDGAQGKIAFGNPGLTGAFSFSCWFKQNGAGSVGTSDYGTLIGWGPTLRIMVRNTDGVVLCQAGGTNLQTNANAAPNGAWHFLIYTWDGTTQKLYIDGQLNVQNVTANVKLNAAFWLGSYAATSVAYSFKGDMDEPMLHNRAIGVNDVQQLYVTGLDTGLSADRSTQSQLRFEGIIETSAPAPDVPPADPPPEITPLPAGDVGGGVSGNISLVPYRAALNAAGLSAPWVGRLLPATQGARDAIALNGLPGLPNATSDNWRINWCNLYGIDPVTNLFVSTQPGGAPLQGGGTPLYMSVGHHVIYVVDDDQPLRLITDHDITVPNWAATLNAAIAGMGGVPMPADAFPDFTGDRYSLLFRPSDSSIWTIYAHVPEASERAVTTMELTGAPSAGGFFLEFDYVDPTNRNIQTFFLQTPVAYNADSAIMTTLIAGAKTASGAAIGATRAFYPTSVVTGGPLNVAPLRIEWPSAMPMHPVAMRATNNFMNSGGVHFTYENSEPWSAARLAAISSPEIGNASHHVMPVSGAGGGTATATGIEQLPMVIDWHEYKIAYDIGMASGWDAPGTDLGHVVALQCGNCGTGAVYPAIRGDGTITNTDGSKMKEGALVTFPLTADKSKVSNEMMPLFNTIQRYGALVYDKTQGGAQFVWRTWGWPGQTVPFPGPSSFVLTPGAYPIYMRQLPWHQMQIIDPADVLIGW